MRKTLLIAAAALAASVISSRAQVYSQNIVGYVNVPLTANTIALVSPALDADGTGTNNTYNSVFPSPSLGDVVFTFNGTAFTGATYKAGPHNSGTNWYIGTTIAGSNPLNVGQGLFYLPAATETATIVGTALTGTVTNSFFPAPGKTALLSSASPIGGGITSVLGYTPELGDVVFTFNGTYTGYTWKAGPHNSGTNWYVGSTISEPNISVGQGFWLTPAGANSWVETVNP
jgi:hypothetical protein